MHAGVTGVRGKRKVVPIPQTLADQLRAVCERCGATYPLEQG